MHENERTNRGISVVGSTIVEIFVVRWLKISVGNVILKKTEARRKCVQEFKKNNGHECMSSTIGTFLSRLDVIFFPFIFIFSFGES